MITFTLPLILFILMAEVAIGSFTVLFLLDWRSTVKRNFLVTYGLIYIGLTALTYLFQQNFSTPDLLNTFKQLDKGWTGYLSLPLLLFLLLMIPYNLFLWLDKRAGVDGKERKDSVENTDAENENSKKEGKRVSTVRILRLTSGALTVLAGLTTLFVMGMIYRPIAPNNAAGIFTVGTFFAAALALGGVMTAMWLGHWYLVTPALSEKPLQFATTLVLIGVLAQVIFAVSSGPTVTHANSPSTIATPTATATTPTTISPAKPNIKPVNAPVATPLSADAISWLRILVAFVMPLVLGSLAWKLIRDRSFQSATGMLYLVVVCAIAGEAIARGLFLMGLN